MTLRHAVVAGRFYPADRAQCVTKIERALPDPLPSGLPEKIVAGVVPHAGWDFSGPTAAQVFAAIRARSTPDTFVLLSAMHRWGVDRPALQADGAWATPLGEIAVDAELAQAVLEEGAGIILDAPEAHGDEHSIEVQVPFIQYLFPQADILPVMIPPDEMAVPAGEAIARAIGRMEQAVVIIGTTDLTHYGAAYYGFAPAGAGEAALEWVAANDRRLIDLMLRMAAEEVVAETRAQRNGCGGGAIAATIAAARAMGAQAGTLVEYTTSYHVMPRGPATDFVGYAAVVFA